MDSRRKFFSTIKQPTSLRQLQVVLGCAAHIAKSLPNYTGLCLPLIKMLRSKPNTKLVFNAAEQTAWERLTKIMDQSQTLTIYDWSHTLFIECDSSFFSCAAVAYFVVDGKRRISSYYSKSFGPQIALHRSSVQKADFFSTTISCLQWM